VLSEIAVAGKRATVVAPLDPHALPADIRPNWDPSGGIRQGPDRRRWVRTCCPIGCRGGGRGARWCGICATSCCPRT